VLLYWKLPAQDKRIFALHLLSFAAIVGIGYFGGELVFGGLATDKAQAAPQTADSGSSGEALVFADVAPIFSQFCASCHAGSDPPQGLRLDAYHAVMAGSRNGPVVVAGKPDESELVKRIRGEAEPRMPYRQDPLSEKRIQRIVDWVRQGAKP
jgi:hypothetical protein